MKRIMVGKQHRDGEPHIEDEWCGLMLCKVIEQEHTAHTHGPISHIHFHRPGDGHDHRTQGRQGAG